MHLESLSLRNFRCYEELLEVPFHPQTIFIGENDIGKSVIIDALQHLLANSPASAVEYRKAPDGTIADFFEVEGRFQLDEHDTIPAGLREAGGTSFRLKKRCNREGGTTWEIFCETFEDVRFETFSGQNAPTQRELLQLIGVQDPGPNGPARQQQFEEARTNARMVNRFKQVNHAELRDHLPKFYCTSSSDYKTPDSVVQRTLQEVVDAALHCQIEDQIQEIEALAPVRDVILQALSAKIELIKPKVRESLPTLRDLRVHPNLDFSRSLTSALLEVDTGEGFRNIEALGEGNKKKLWMGLLEWQRESVAETVGQNSIRAYDEPDVNLHYEAQRKLFVTMTAPLAVEGARTQVVISTHSVQLIDRAPVESINLMRKDDAGVRRLHCIRGDAEADFRGFFDIVARSIGLTNSALFYERAFLVVEGPSEENALPMLYSNLYGHPMIHDGIVLINLEGCGAWRSLLRVLQRNREDQTVMLLDQDCTQANSSGYVSAASLNDVGFSAHFMTNGCFYVGQKEFEDAFADSELLAAMNSNFPRQDGRDWISEDLPDRATVLKFSDDLMSLLRTAAAPTTRQSAKKPTFAGMLARVCITETQVPLRVREAFNRLRIISGVAQ